MKRCMLKGKIHGAKVTDANVKYEGSITIDGDLMDAADITPYEQVQVWNLNSGERLETYAIPAEAGSGEVCINGAAAHRIKKGETVIIATFAWMNEREVKAHSPSVVFVDGHNRIGDKPGKLNAKPRLVSG
ncbi:MAG: aspartate 1-decarboxylase [Deltaproteobacteria bacterium]|nr:aspartate 1-decarboxylase [Deltaproteobacteria bacterium]MCZ6623549.1 aspartate 1-decarboxylase [Deltaproteobacteria bacterium]